MTCLTIPVSFVTFTTKRSEFLDISVGFNKEIIIVGDCSYAYGTIINS